MAVSIAKLLGAHVTAVCSTKDIARVRSYGADVILDRSIVKDPLKHGDTKYDVIFDTPNVLSATKCLRKLTKTGAYVGTLPNLTCSVECSGLRCLAPKRSNSFLLSATVLTWTWLEIGWPKNSCRFLLTQWLFLFLPWMLPTIVKTLVISMDASSSVWKEDGTRRQTRSRQSKFCIHHYCLICVFDVFNMWLEQTQ